MLSNDKPGPANESNQSLILVGLSDFVGGTAAIDGTNIVFTPAKDYYGPASFVYTLQDDGTTNGQDDFLTSTATVHFNIAPNNNPPVFTGGANQTAFDEDVATHGPAQEQIVANWASNVSAGAGESGQTLRFHVDNDNHAIFAVQPTIDADGTLRYTPLPNANDIAHVTVTLQDDGGGPDKSLPQQFTIEIKNSTSCTTQRKLTVATAAMLLAQPASSLTAALSQAMC